MFGAYRTILALAVVAHHLLSFPTIGQYAVHGFFILSGYLMTLIMHKSYGYSVKGFGSFVFNRILRLYPAYWIITILSIGAILVLGESNARSYHSAIYLPTDLAGWLQNASLVYMDWYPMRVFPRLSPPTWALTLELAFYLTIALGASKSKRSTIAWFGISVIFTVCTHFYERGADYRYLFVGAASLPFSIGALTYHYRVQIEEKARRFSDTKSLCALLGLFVINSLVAGVLKYFHYPEFLQSACFYLNLVINFVIIAILLTKPSLPISAAVDKKIGDYSYPIYLAHWQAGMVVSFLIFQQPERGPHLNGAVCFLGALALCFFVSYLIIRFVDEPIERYRSTVRQRAKQLAMTSNLRGEARESS